MGKDKKEKKDKKNKEEKAPKKATGTADDPIVLEGVEGVAAWADIKATSDAAEVGDEIFWTTDIGLVSGKVIERGGKKQTSWKFNGKQAKSTIIAQRLSGGAEEPEEKKAGKSKKESADYLITEEQLGKKYPIESLSQSLETAQYGKKKQRAKLIEGFEKKKAKGQAIVDAIKEAFGEVPDFDLFSIFERMDNI